VDCTRALNVLGDSYRSGTASAIAFARLSSGKRSGRPIRGAALNEAFSLAVGPRSGGAGAFVALREDVVAFAELFRYEGRAVVGQNPLHSDVLLCEPRDGIAEERAGRPRCARPSGNSGGESARREVLDRDAGDGSDRGKGRRRHREKPRLAGAHRVRRRDAGAVVARRAHQACRACDRLQIRGRGEIGNKANRLSGLLGLGALKPVYHGASALLTLRELVKGYVALVQDGTRVMVRQFLA